MSGRLFALRAFTSVCWLPAAAHALTHDVSISGLRFVPNNLTIEVGDTVRWSNSGGTHDVTANDGSWGSVTSASWVYSRTFNSVEEVRCHCSVHSSPGANINTSMNGRVSVVAATANQAPNGDFAVSCDSLDCSFTDQSTDADGVIDVRSWDFGDGDTASLEVSLTSGGAFDAASPMPETGPPIGTIKIAWTSCNAGALTYDLPALGLGGTIAIERIVLDKVPACERAQP